MTLYINENLQEKRERGGEGGKQGGREREENQLKVIMQGDHDAATIKNRHLF